MYIAFRTPPVQRYVTGLIGEQLSKQLGTKVTLEGIDIDWLEGVELAGVYVEDQQQDTLLYVGLLAAYIEPSALLNKTASVRLIEVRDTYINVYQPEGDTALNFAFIPEAFASEDTTTTPEDTTASAWNIELYRLLLDDIRVDFRADGTEMSMALNELSMLFESLGLEESFIQGDELTIDGLRVALALPPTDTSATVAADTTTTEPPPPVATGEPGATGADSSNIINPSGFRYALNKFLLENSQVAYRIKGSEESTLQQINFEDLVVDQLNVEINDIYVGETEARLNVPRFTFVEAKSGFRLDELALAAQVDMPQVAAQLNALETNHSNLNGNIELSMTLEESTAALVESLKVDSRLNSAVIGLADARYFTNALDSMPAVEELSPQLSWQITMADGDGKIQDFALTVDDQAKLLLNGSFRDVAAALDSTATESPYFNIEVPELSTNLGFIEQFTPPASQQYIPPTNDPNLLLTASAEGYLSDLEAKVTLESGVGNLVAEAQYAQPDEQYTDVQAKVQANNFNLGQLVRPFVGDTLARDFDRLSFHADADVRQRATARDTTLQRAKVNLVVDELGYKDHRYQDLIVRGTMAGDAVEAQIRYEDSLLNLMTNARANLKQETYQLDLHLQDANLFRLNLVSDSIIIKNSKLQASIQGTDPDKLTGFVKLADTEVVKDVQSFVQDSILFTAEQSGGNRLLTLVADHMKAVISGQFTVAELPQAFEDFEQYYFAASEAETNADIVNTRETEGQRVNVQLDIAETPTLAQAFVPELVIPEPISLEADFNSAEKYLKFDVSVPHLEYSTNVIDSLTLNAVTNKRQIDMLLSVDYVRAGGLTIPQVRLDGHLSGEVEEQARAGEPLATTVVDFNLKMGQSDSPYRLDLTTQVRSGQDTIAVLLDDLELMIENAAWETPRNARITYAENYLDIRNLYLKQGDQEIALRTKQEGSSTNLEVVIEQLLLNPLFSVLDLEDYQVEGTLFGEATVRDMFTPGPIDADFKINRLAVQDTVLGNLALQVQKDIPVSETEDIVDVLLTLQGKSNDLKVAGNYNLAAGPGEEALDLQVDLNRLALAEWQPLAQDVLKELSGTLRADMSIQGSVDQPSINGNFIFADEVVITPAMTDARLYIENQKIQFTGDQMTFDEFTLLDSARTPAVLDGSVLFADLTNPRVDLTFSTENFIFVSSKSYDNEEFYGRAVASADLAIGGPTSEIAVKGNVSVDEGTNMTIALVSGPEEAAQAGFVNFVDVSEFAKADTVLQDSLALVSAQPETDSVQLSGFILSTEVSVDPEARFTVVIDPVNGDRLAISGEANLKVDQNLQGDLTMQGPFIVNDGSYLLTFAKVIKKEFAVRKGSSITWSGDPANAAMDMTAVYTVETTLADIGGPDVEAPANVLLSIGGYLENPELSFGIEIPNAESLGATGGFSLTQNIERMQQDETLLYKNVFGLIVLGRFIPQGGGSAASSGGGVGEAANDQINNSVSQLLTSQLSRLSEDYLGGVEIDVGLESNQAGGSGVAGRDVDVALSKQLFDDRLSVTVGGTTAAGQGSSSGFAGEFQVLYRITENGNLNLKAFQNSERNLLTNQIEDNAGVSLFHQNSFDQFFAGEQETLKSRSLEDPSEDQSAPAPALRGTSERRQRKEK